MRYLESNGEFLARNKKWQEENKDKCISRGVRYRINNAENEKARTKKWRNENADRVKELVSSWAKNNKKQVRERIKNWLRETGNQRIYDSRRKARIKNNGGFLSTGIVKTLYEAQNGICNLCKLELNGNYHLDHIIPISLGGENSDRNVQLLHPICNIKKGAKYPYSL